MTIRSDITINWTVSPRIVEVPAPSLTVQDLYDTLRSKAAAADAMDDDEIIDGSGKDSLGEGVLVGLTVKLLNAKVKFEAQASPTICTISGGNLIAVDESGEVMSPIEPSPNVTVVLAQSTSASLIEGTGADPEVIADAVWDEPLASHAGAGTVGEAIDTIGDHVDSIQADLDDPSQYKADVSGLALETSVQDLMADVAFLCNIEGGRWKIVDNQMIFCTTSDSEVVAIFDLLDANGRPTMINVMERVRVGP